MSKEYLDRKEVEKMIFNLLRHSINNYELKILEGQIERVANQICQLKPKNQVTRKEIIDILESDEVQQEIIKAIIQSRNTVWTNKEFTRAIINRIYNGIRNRIILEEE